MLMVICKHRRTGKTSLLREGRKFKFGGNVTRNMIETVAKLPKSYKVGEVYISRGYEYTILEI